MAIDEIWLFWCRPGMRRLIISAALHHVTSSLFDRARRRWRRMGGVRPPYRHDRGKTSCTSKDYQVCATSRQRSLIVTVLLMAWPMALSSTAVHPFCCNDMTGILEQALQLPLLIDHVCAAAMRIGTHQGMWGASEQHMGGATHREQARGIGDVVACFARPGDAYLHM